MLKFSYMLIEPQCLWNIYMATDNGTWSMNSFMIDELWIRIVLICIHVLLFSPSSVSRSQYKLELPLHLSQRT